MLLRDQAEVVRFDEDDKNYIGYWAELPGAWAGEDGKSDSFIALNRLDKPELVEMNQITIDRFEE